MQYSGQIPTILASAFWKNRGLNRFMPSLIDLAWYLLQSACVRDKVENLLHVHTTVVTEHLLHVSIESQLVAAIHPPAKRVKNVMQLTSI